jgi:hypothetical protein
MMMMMISQIFPENWSPFLLRLRSGELHTLVMYARNFPFRAHPLFSDVMQGLEEYRGLCTLTFLSEDHIMT